MGFFKRVARVREQTATVGTGTLTLIGTTQPNDRDFATWIGNGNFTTYCLLSGNGTDSEEGLGTVTVSGPTTTFSRDRIFRSTNAGSAISLTGTSTVFVNFIPGDMPEFGGACWYQPANLATTGALPANTYANGVNGVGATLTATGNGALTVDGIATVAGYRILVKDEANTAHNGIYFVTNAGGVSTPYVLTRTHDFDAAYTDGNSQLAISEGGCVCVGAAGVTNGRTIWTFYTAATNIVVGTSDFNFSVIGIRASQGLDLFGSAQDDLLVRGASNWIALPKGSIGQTVGVDGSNHVAYLAPKYIIGASIDGLLTASQRILYHRFTKAVTIPANFGAYLGHSSQAGGSANATASTVINVDKAVTAAPNTFSNVGTITIAATSVTPTFASSGGTAISFAAGDVMRIMAPASPDATFAGFYASIVGFET